MTAYMVSRENVDGFLGFSMGVSFSELPISGPWGRGLHYHTIRRLTTHPTISFRRPSMPDFRKFLAIDLLESHDHLEDLG